MSPLNWKGKPYRPIGGTGFIRVYKPDINELLKPLSMKKGLGSAILTGNAINPQNEPESTPAPTPSFTPTNTPTLTPTVTITSSLTPTLTPEPTSTPTLTNTCTPTVTQTEPYDIYLFEECGNPSNQFRFEYVPGILNVGDVYYISGGTSSLIWDTTTSTWSAETSNWDSGGAGVFNGYATVITYSAVGTIYSSAGVTFTLQGACPSPTPSPTNTNTPTPSITATLTPSVTLTRTPDVTPSETPTNTPTLTQTITNTPSVTQTNTPSATPPAFSPSGLTNLQFWFMADSGFTASNWTNYGLMGGSITQATAANQPSATTITMGSWTGTGIQFLSRDYMFNTSFSNTNFSGRTMFWVARKIGGGSYDQHACIIYSGASNNTMIYSVRGGGGGNENQGIVFSDARYYFSAAQPSNLFITISGTTSKSDAYRNGSLLSTSAATFTNGNNVTSLIMGNDPGVANGSDIRIVEVIIYNTVLDSTDYNKVKDYIETKYQYSTW